MCRFVSWSDDRADPTSTTSAPAGRCNLDAITTCSIFTGAAATAKLYRYSAPYPDPPTPRK